MTNNNPKSSMNTTQLLIDLRRRLEDAERYQKNLDSEKQYCEDCIGHEAKLEADVVEAERLFRSKQAEAQKAGKWRGKTPDDTHQADSAIWAPLKQAQHKLKLYRAWMESLSPDDILREAEQIDRWAEQAVRGLEDRIRQLSPKPPSRRQHWTGVPGAFGNGRKRR